MTKTERDALVNEVERLVFACGNTGHGGLERIALGIRDRLAALPVSDAEPVAVVGRDYWLHWCDEYPTKRVRVGDKLYAAPEPPR